MATQHILDEVEKDITQGNGPVFVKSRLKDRDIAVPRCVVSLITRSNGSFLTWIHADELYEM